MVNRNTIINQALLLIGEEMVAAEGDGSKNSDIASELFDLTLETALSEHDWSFARARKTLPLMSTGPEFGYESRFLLPDDYNHIIIEPEGDFDYRIEGGYLLADIEALDLLYIANITNLNLLSAKFVDAVVTLLASKIAYAITGSPQLAGQMEQLYDKRIGKAKMFNESNIGYEESEVDTWVEDR